VKSIGFNAKECRKGLESYSAEIEELIELVKDSASLTPAQIDEARTQLANLKSCLKRASCETQMRGAPRCLRLKRPYTLQRFTKHLQT